MDIDINMNTLANDINVATEYVMIIKNEMKKMFNSIEEMDAMWDGAASEAFRKQFVIDMDIFGEICEEATDLIECMSKSNGLYRKCDQTVSSKIKSIRV